MASDKSLVTLAAGLGKVKAEAKGKLKAGAEGYASDTLLLITNCR